MLFQKKRRKYFVEQGIGMFWFCRFKRKLYKLIKCEIFNIGMVRFDQTMGTFW